MLLLCANCGYQGMSNMTECNPILTPFAVMHLLWVHKNFFASRFCKLIKITHWCFILTRRWLLHPSSSLIWHIEYGAVLWQYVNHNVILNCCIYVKDNFYKNYSTAYLLLNNILSTHLCTLQNFGATQYWAWFATRLDLWLKLLIMTVKINQSYLLGKRSGAPESNPFLVVQKSSKDTETIECKTIFCRRYKC